MNSEDRIIEINQYLGIKELICKKCGSILDIKEINVETSFTKRHQAIFWAICPDCGAKIRRLRNSKVDRVFWRGSMHNIANLDTSLLIWMLQVGYIKEEKLKSAVEHHLKGRIVSNKSIEPMSIQEQQEITLKKELRALKAQLEAKEQEKAEVNHSVIMNAATWDALKMGQAIKRINALAKKIVEIKKDIEIKEKAVAGA
jgi:PIN domain nuclease of toxin-antitoxin system